MTNSVFSEFVPIFNTHIYVNLDRSSNRLIVVTMQWPGAYCDAKGRSCCFPDNGKPSTDFSIHGLWPNYNDGGYPSNCDSSKPFDESQVSFT